jgi:hypothetical protein
MALLKKQITLSRPVCIVLGVVALGLAVAAWKLTDPTDKIKKELETDGNVIRVHKPIPVLTNRSAEVLDGFRGDVHPILHDKTRLEVKAFWTPLERSGLKIPAAPEVAYSWYTQLRPAAPQMIYTEREFSGFLPESVREVGQTWALDPEKVIVFLKQFHANPSLHLVATGRRAGPDGAFAILRAVSSTHLEIVFRVHAEFYVTPKDWDPKQPIFAWYTPAYFSGRLVVNKKAGTVEHFRFALATEKALNVFLTVNPSLMGIPKLGHDIVRVDRMELLGGNATFADSLSWTSSLPLAEANRKLARVFYKFEEIDWVPLDQVLPQARSKNRPIFAIVSWGATDDQSC